MKNDLQFAHSDINLKENIREIPSSAIDKVANVALKTYNFKPSHAEGFSDRPIPRTLYGIIAQDAINNGLGNLVAIKDDGYLGVDYTSFLVLKVAQLEKKISELEEKIKETRKK